ncbi:hypothetical protein K1719_027680 [Acacia pycnantha]|nr:hypothetical protein K1719_027680 [Acacia pycnantha]
MKTLLLLHSLVLSLCFLLAFTTTALAKDSYSYIRDVQGEVLNNGGLYYIFPVHAGNGGGLELARTGSEKCPRTVVQSPSDTSKGLPARLTSRLRFLRSDLLLNIEFELQNPTVCHGEKGERIQWKVVGRSQIVKASASVDEEEEEKEATTGPFKIQPYRGFYKLVYCQRDQSDECRDLGISVDHQENRRLIVKDGEPLLVVFIKAESSGDEDMVE